jgi:Tfp pilus assembly protein PilZ
MYKKLIIPFIILFIFCFVHYRISENKSYVDVIYLSYQPSIPYLFVDSLDIIIEPSYKIKKEVFLMKIKNVNPKLNLKEKVILIKNTKEETRKRIIIPDIFQKSIILDNDVRDSLITTIDKKQLTEEIIKNEIRKIDISISTLKKTNCLDLQISKDSKIIILFVKEAYL